MKKGLVLMWVLATAVALGGELPLAGVQLGMSLQDFLLHAKQMKLNLIGPNKELVHATLPVQVQKYVIGRDRLLVPQAGVQRQGLLLLRDRVVGVELLFETKEAWENFGRTLGECGYQKEGNLYVGKLTSGRHAGAQVLVLPTSSQGKSFTITVLSVQVLDKDLTVPQLLEAQTRSAGTNPANRAL